MGKWRIETKIDFTAAPSREQAIEFEYILAATATADGKIWIRHEPKIQPTMAIMLPPAKMTTSSYAGAVL